MVALSGRKRNADEVVLEVSRLEAIYGHRVRLSVDVNLKHFVVARNHPEGSVIRTLER